MYLVLSLVGLFCVLCLCLILALYAAGALAAARVARTTIPIVGNWVGDQIVAWVLGAHESNTVWATPPVPDTTPQPNPTVMVTPWPTRDPSEPCSVPNGLPVSGPITQLFHPGHSGVDIGVVKGTSDRATMCGTVTFAGWNSQGYGYLVIVSNGRFSTYYAHNSQVTVSVGQWVEAQQTVALSGNTGHSTGPHVHYEVRENGSPVDPMIFIGPGSG